jgi:hypothetical protein
MKSDLALFIDRSIEVGPAASDAHVGFVNAPGGASSACEGFQRLPNSGTLALDPAHHRRMSQRNASLSHHFHEVANAELEPEIPPDAKDDDLPVEMAALEKVIHVRHPERCPQKYVCGEYAPLPPFAPEAASIGSSVTAAAWR